MAQKVTALAALAEDTDASPSNQMAAHNHLEPQFRELSILSWSPQTLQSWGTQIHSGKIPIHLKVSKS